MSNRVDDRRLYGKSLSRYLHTYSLVDVLDLCPLFINSDF